MMLQHMRADFLQMKREPILLLFPLLSVFMIFVFKILILYGIPLANPYVAIDLETYAGYGVVMVYLLQPVMLGTVMGFFMLDEKDAGIASLLSVTPLGIGGYLLNRLLMPVTLTGLYTFIIRIVFDEVPLKIGGFLVLLIFLMSETVMIGLFISRVSEDKVKGLTNAKAVSALTVAGFARLFRWQGASIIGRMTPQFYVADLLLIPSLTVILIGGVIHLLWLALLLRVSLNKL